MTRASARAVSPSGSTVKGLFTRHTAAVIEGCRHGNREEFDKQQVVLPGVVGYKALSLGAEREQTLESVGFNRFV